MVENKWFTEYKRTRNRVLVFHTKQGIIIHKKNGEGVIKCQFLRKVDGDQRNLLLAHLLLIPTQPSTGPLINRQKMSSP